MNDQIREIAERLRGLRDALDIGIVEAAACVKTTPADFEKYESGNFDIPMSFLYEAAQAFHVEISTLISGQEPHASTYFITRKGTGASIERTKAYKYQSLAHGFRSAKAEPFEVTVEPNDAPIHLNAHAGQEFNFILDGTLQLQIAGNEIILNKGDSIYFDSSKPHGMKALNGTKTRFLAIIM
ncbi:MAG: cupin domain-containing protein [Prolixibacteraceae bacterium]|nr:cupin domain-containing protein [Prolixibacteraceae bacterium]